MKIKAGFDIPMDIRSLMNPGRKIKDDELSDIVPGIVELIVSDLFVFSIEHGKLFYDKYEIDYKIEKKIIEKDE